jgi:hypothetical protein
MDERPLAINSAAKPVCDCHHRAHMHVNHVTIAGSTDERLKQPFATLVRCANHAQISRFFLAFSRRINLLASLMRAQSTPAEATSTP